MKITAAVATEPMKPLELEELELADELLPHEVLVKIVASGICHTDVMMRDLPDGYETEGVEVFPRPSVPGHEGAGIVQRVGGAITHLEAGDHVIMSFDYDGDCSFCNNDLEPYCVNFMPYNYSGKRRDGSYALSSDKYPRISAGHHHQSSFATYCIATEHNCVKVPKDQPLKKLAPLGCGFLTGAGGVRNLLKPEKGSSFVVIGAGPVGFGALFIAKKMGCYPIIAVDLHDSRLELAKSFGATHTVNASQVDDSLKAIFDICESGVNYSVEAAGSVITMNQAFQALAINGSCVCIGAVVDPDALIQIKPADLLRGRSIFGISGGHGDIAATIGDLVEGVNSGEFQVEEIITYYDFADINQAIADSKAGKTLKPVLLMAEQ